MPAVEPRPSWRSQQEAIARRLVSEDRFGRVLLVLVALGFLSIAAAGLAALGQINKAAEHRAWVEHTYQVELMLADVERTVERLETTRRGYLLAAGPITRATLADIYRHDDLALRTDLGAFQQLTTDNPKQQANATLLERLLGAQRDRQRASMRLADSGDRAAAQARFVAEFDLRPMVAIRAQLSAMRKEERALLGVRTAEQIASLRAFYLVLAIAAALLASVAALSFAVIRRFTRDLTASRDGLRALNATLEQRVAERTADLTRANEEIQRFAYIVSHDLRSPLVNVMGFTSELESALRPLAALVDRVERDAPALLDADARLAVREDAPEALGFIRTSTQKMDRLIAAILKLSREGRRVINPERIDMDALVRGIRDSLRRRLDDRGVSFSIQGPLPAAVSDRLSVEQILSNLIENAIKYLQPGRPGEVVVRGREAKGRLIYDVVDNGRGIAPADHDRIFELFRRSGAQDQPGEGIGLAHVRPLAHRLGGSIDMTSTLGQGSTFSLTLPATPGSPSR